MKKVVPLLLMLIIFFFLLAGFAGADKSDGESAEKKIDLWQNGKKRANQPTLAIAGIDLQLRMSYNEVVKKLGNDFQLIKSRDEIFIIASNVGPPFDAYGSVWFEAGKLQRISKFWGNFRSDDAGQLTEMLFQSLLKMNGKRANISIKSLAYKDQPNIIINKLEIDFGKSGVSVSYWSDDLERLGISNKVSITEHKRNQQSYALENFSLSAGLTKAAVSGLLADAYYVEEAGNNILIINSASKEECVGLLYFKDDHLTGISKNLIELRSQEPDQLAQLLCALAASIIQGDSARAYVRLVDAQDEELAVKQITIDFSGKELILMIINDDQGKPQVHIEEDIVESNGN